MNKLMVNAGILMINGMPNNFGAVAHNSGILFFASKKLVVKYLGSTIPNQSKKLVKLPLQEMATVMFPMAYSNSKSQPIIHAISSPNTAYE